MLVSAVVMGYDPSLTPDAFVTFRTLVAFSADAGTPEIVKAPVDDVVELYVSASNVTVRLETGFPDWS
jgi:hypothetical protein